MKSAFTGAVIVGAAAVLIACGGGGSEGAYSPPPSTPINVVQGNPACRAPIASARGVPRGLTLGPAQITVLPAPALDGSRGVPLDWDGDGDTDVVRMDYSYPFSSTYTGTLRLFRNDGGTLVDVSASAILGTVVPDHPRDFEVADFTGDGVLDLYVAQHGFDAPPYPGAPNLFLTLSEGKLSDSFSTIFSPPAANAFSHGSASGDVDCDGDIDIVELNLNNGGANRLWLNDNTGKFSVAPASAFPVANQLRWQEAAFIDIDKDGDLDLFLGARSGPGWNEDILLVNDGFGRFHSAPDVRLPEPFYSAAHAVNNAKAADFDGDGLQDLLLFEIPGPFSSVSKVRLWRNLGNGRFSDISLAWGLPNECTGEVVEPLFVTDLNGDGWPDFLMPGGCTNLGSPGVMLNTGNGFTFRPHQAIANYLEFDLALPIDVNSDGKLDLFFAERGGNPVLVLQQ